MLKIIIPAFLIFCSLTVLADDYLVTAKNDTLRGKVAIQTYGPIDHIQVTTSDKKKTVLTAIQVATVFLNGDFYNPVRTEFGYRMMKLVKPGFVSLYLGRRATSPNDPGFYYDTQFLVKRDGSSIEVPNLSFKKTMSNFLSECDDMREKIDKEDLGRKDLDKILSDFNTCIEVQTTNSKVAPALTNDDQRMVMLTELKTKIEASSLSAKKDALDILNDVIGKVQHNQNVPNYQFDGLRSTLKESAELSAEFEKLVPMLNKP